MSAEQIKAIFSQGDKDGNGYISKDELADVLKLLGDTSTDVATVFTKVDANHDGKVSFDEFVDWLMSDSSPTASLEEVFSAFCGGHADMDNKQFIKFCKDTHLVDKKLTSTDVDLIFTKVVSKGQRRIGFEQFSSALQLIAEKKGATPEKIYQTVLGAGGPVLHGTVAESVKFYDDKSTFTGTWAHGGPEHVAKGGGTHADDSWKRSSPRSLEPRSRPATQTVSGAATPQPQTEPRSGAALAGAAHAESSGGGTVSSVFAAYCGSHADMDGKTFSKLCKDSHLLDKKWTTTDVDLSFQKVLPKGQRRISQPQFETLLQMIADKKGVDVEDVRTQVAAVGGPILHGTSADAVRFHDDKSTFTGTHVNGGPESVAKGGGTAADSSWKRQN